VTEDEYHEQLAKLWGGLLHFRVNEPILAARFEEFMDPKPVYLSSGPDLEKLNASLRKLDRDLGGVPDRDAAVSPGGDRVKYDQYGTAVLDEMVNYFPRCRVSVVRAHLSMIAKWLLDKNPDVVQMPDTQRTAMNELLKDMFWEEAEAAFIRLASYWDRVGQLLDFMYFNIRQYDRDGFAAVMARIHSNYYPVYPELRISEAYQRLNAFQRSEAVDGLQWLLRRRNLLVHSVRLRQLHEPGPEQILEFSYNHLEDRYRKRLQAQEPAEENRRLHAHLGKCAELLPDIIELSNLALRLRLHATVHQRPDGVEEYPDPR
jgi:hypothetical protein